MKYLVTLALVAFGFFASYSQTAQSQIVEVLMTQQKAWNEGDIEAFMNGYWRNDSLVFIGSKGLTYGWEQTLNNYKKSYPDKAAMGQLTFDIKKLIVSDDQKSAFVIGKWSLQRKADNPNGHFTLLWRKIEYNWVIVADHSS